MMSYKDQWKKAHTAVEQKRRDAIKVVLTVHSVLWLFTVLSQDSDSSWATVGFKDRRKMLTLR